MTKIFFFIIMVISLQTAYGQSPRPCSISPESQELIKQRMLLNRVAFKNSLQTRSAGSIYIPVRFWLTANDDGSDRFTDYYKLLTAFCETNKCIGDHSMIFFLKGINDTINNDLVHQDPLKNAAIQLFKELNLLYHDAINIFITNPDDFNVFYYHITDDFIVLDHNISEDRSLCHLLGHYFTLPHTSGDWLDYNCFQTTLEQRRGMKLPEYVSRTKTDSLGITICAYAGDGFCDTDADYAEYSYPIDPCIYMGCAKDPDGEKLHPDLSNPMTIGSHTSCFDTFSNQQKQAMLFDYLTPERDYIKVNYHVLGPVGIPQYIEPKNQIKLTRYDSVYFDWDDVPNATDYVLDIDLSTSFKLFPQQYRTKESHFLVTSLDPLRRYHWRVLAYNANSFCLVKPIISNFSTGNLSTAVENTNSKLYNQSSKGSHLILEFHDEYYSNAEFHLFDINGRLIQTIQPNNAIVEIDKNYLTPGIYMFLLTSDKLPGNIIRGKLLNF